MTREQLEEFSDYNAVKFNGEWYFMADDIEFLLDQTDDAIATMQPARYIIWIEHYDEYYFTAGEFNDALKQYYAAMSDPRYARFNMIQLFEYKTNGDYWRRRRAESLDRLRA